MEQLLIKTIKLSLFLSVFGSALLAQPIILVDFGDSESKNMYELENWDQLLLGDEMIYSTSPASGVSLGSVFEEFTDFMGVQGLERTFSLGERIAVTWFNTSDETIFFTSRISFDDNDQPNGGTSEGKWMTMRSYDDYRNTLIELPAYSGGKTVFNITDKGVHKSDETYSLVNINIAVEWGQSDYKQYLICDKIELLNDSDVESPSTPSNLSAVQNSDSKITLSWDEANDNSGVVEYLVYNDNVVEGYTRENSYTAVYLEPEKEYNFSVTALDQNRNESLPSETITNSTQKYNHSNYLINPSGFAYRGAFKLPEDFAWGGEAIAFKNFGNVSNGSLYVTNLNQPENGLVGEVSIPAPIISPTKDFESLPTSQIMQSPTNIRPGNINSWDYVDIWRTGLEYYPAEDALYSSWSIHYTVSGEKHSTITRCSASNLSDSEKEGAWYLGSPTEFPNEAMMSDYLFTVPQTWADDNSNGQSLVTGRFRDGGLSGLGPTMYSFAAVDDGDLPPDSEMDFTTLLEYGSVAGTDNYNYPNSIDGYKHSDIWRDASFLTRGDQSAFMVIGNKALGDNWYGYHGENMKHEWVAYDFPYPDFYATDPNGKGWRSHEFIPMAIFFDPSDLAQSASGSIPTHEPQPYSAIRFDQSIFYGSVKEIRSAAFDFYNGILYAAEFDVARDGFIIIHVWQLETVVNLTDNHLKKNEFRLEQNYPNPFNPTTVIDYCIPSDNGSNLSLIVQLNVYNMLGQKVATLVNEQKSAGRYQVNFNASGFASGLYYYQLKYAEYVQTKKMILVK